MDTERLKEIDWTKPVLFRQDIHGDCQARLICSDRVGRPGEEEFTYVVLYTYNTGTEFAIMVDKYGRMIKGRAPVCYNPVTSKKGWINIFKPGSHPHYAGNPIYSSKEIARDRGERSPDTYVDSVLISWEE